MASPRPCALWLPIPAPCACPDLSPPYSPVEDGVPFVKLMVQVMSSQGARCHGNVGTDCADGEPRSEPLAAWAVCLVPHAGGRLWYCCGYCNQVVLMLLF